jgi:hypothetical protein
MNKLITTAFLLMALANVSYGQDTNTAESIVDGLSRLAELHEQGLLDDEEFNAAKRQLLGLSPTEQTNNPVSSRPNSNSTSTQDNQTINYSKGVYVGTINQYQNPSGQGTMTYADGSVYVGQFRNGPDRHGQGTLTDANGVVQSGTWWSDRLITDVTSPDNANSLNGAYNRTYPSTVNGNSSSPTNQASTSNANQNQSPGNERTESLCTSYGFTPNTDAHANCVMNIDTQQRAANNEASRRAAQSLFNLGTGLINGPGNRSTTSRCRLIGDTSGQIYTFSRIGCPVGYVPAL